MSKFSKYKHRLLTYMQIVTLVALFLLLIPMNFAHIADDNSFEKGTLVIRISGFENDHGECWFALDNSEDVYESVGSVVIGKIIPIINNEVILMIDSVKYGNYAIRVFHDENSNRELDTNFLGIPTEDYGYSNNASSWFGPPSWEKAMFMFNQKEMTLEISVD